MNAISCTIQRAREVSGLSRSTLYNLMNDGKLATSKVGGRRLVLVDSLEALVKGGAETEAA